jgi:alanine racemase/UDP-N-acetylmuramoyl-tripeptide--D-alanyl-D-alanine ligase
MLQERVKNIPLMVMVKANAYGTLLLPYVKLLQSLNVNFFGVAFVSEALQLREQGIQSNLLVLYTHPSEAKHIVLEDLTPCIGDELTLEVLEKEAIKYNKKIKVHLYLDTGMHRLGCSLEEAFRLALRISKSRYCILEGVMTHLAAANNVDEIVFTKKQIAIFQSLLDWLQTQHITYTYAHIANSSAVFQKLPLYDMVRLGLAPLGSYPTLVKPTAPLLEPAIRLESQIIKISTINKGDSVGYQRKYYAKNDNEKIALIPIGYHDGVHNIYAKEGLVLINRQLAPIAGIICMDFMMVVVTHIKDVQVGDTCLFFGKDHPLEKVAKSGGTSPHQLLACIGPRVQRELIYDQSIEDACLSMHLPPLIYNFS